MKKITFVEKKYVKVEVISQLNELNRGDYIKLFNRYEENINSNEHSYGLVVYKDENIALIKWAKSTKYYIINDNMIKESMNLQIIEPQEFTAQAI